MVQMRKNEAHADQGSAPEGLWDVRLSFFRDIFNLLCVSKLFKDLVNVGLGVAREAPHHPVQLFFLENVRSWQCCWWGRYWTYGDRHYMKMANYLDGVELLDLNLDPGDVVVVEVLHLLQLVFQPVFVVSCGYETQTLIYQQISQPQSSLSSYHQFIFFPHRPFLILSRNLFPQRSNIHLIR